MIIMIREFLIGLYKTQICIIRGHVIDDDEIRRAVKDDMFIACRRCGMHQPIIIDDDDHIRIDPTGDPEIFISGGDLGHKSKYENN